MNNNNKSGIEVLVKKIPTGTMRKYTKTEMENIFLSKHPELLQEVVGKSYSINSVSQAASVFVSVFIDECLDIDTLESDEDRRKRIKESPTIVDDLWDLISEKV